MFTASDCSILTKIAKQLLTTDFDFYSQCSNTSKQSEDVLERLGTELAGVSSGKFLSPCPNPRRAAADRRHPGRSVCGSRHRQSQRRKEPPKRPRPLRKPPPIRLLPARRGVGGEERLVRSPTARQTFNWTMGRSLRIRQTNAETECRLLYPAPSRNRGLEHRFAINLHFAKDRRFPSEEFHA